MKFRENRKFKKKGNSYTSRFIFILSAIVEAEGWKLNKTDRKLS